ncbi:hypothetical protein [Psychrobacter sp. SMN/5/1215-MNA-CIBAN-0208]|uniref:hypothetical protein n=1 Tax=Psychrobacter sp. SMN/5/1215-MNA-CIBAN-0208 TaxID=3140442 RepID=UPI000B195EC0
MKVESYKISNTANKAAEKIYHDWKIELVPQKIVIKTIAALFFGEKKACIAQA